MAKVGAVEPGCHHGSVRCVVTPSFRQFKDFEYRMAGTRPILHIFDGRKNHQPPVMKNAEAKQLNSILAQVQRELNRHDRLSAAALGIGSAEDLQMLRLLLSDGPMRVGELAARRSSSVATASARLDRLERRGLIIRERRPNDRRVVVATLTAEGEKTARLNQSQRTAALQPLDQNFPVGELAVVIDVLTESLDDARRV